MKCERYYEPHSGKHVLMLEFNNRDLEQADFRPHDWEMTQALERQQVERPTAEGALMVAQQYVAAIERGNTKGE